MTKAPLAASRVYWIPATVLMVLALLWPALWNGFPLVFYDTGGYLVRAFDSTLGLGRSTVYGMFLALGIPFHFWTNVAAQAALVVWLIVLTLRIEDFGGRPALAMAVVMGLAFFTGIPWYAGQLMPDIFVVAAVLALYLLAFGDRREHAAMDSSAVVLQSWERALLVAVVAFAVASHMATLALAVGLLVTLFVLRRLATPLKMSRPAILLPTVSVAVGTVLLLASNFAISGRFAITPGGENFIFAHLLDDGIVARYLDDKCPDPSLRLCAFRDRLPPSGNDWMWVSDSPLHTEFGGGEGFAPEATRVIGEILRRYPGLVLKSALQDMLYQFVLNRSWDGPSEAPHTAWAIQTYAPDSLASFSASRQQHDRLQADELTAHHTPIAFAALFALPLIVAFGFYGLVRRSTAAFALFALLALLGNAAICGALSIPSPRYQSRLAPLALFAVTLAALGRCLTRRTNAAPFIENIGDLSGRRCR
jgi:hypothetical protein